MILVKIILLKYQIYLGTIKSLKIKIKKSKILTQIYLIIKGLNLKSLIHRIYSLIIYLVKNKIYQDLLRINKLKDKLINKEVKEFPLIKKLTYSLIQTNNKTKLILNNKVIQ
jgi:hypothetical protein